MADKSRWKRWLDLITPRSGRVRMESGEFVNTADVAFDFSQSLDPFNQVMTAEYTPILERKPLPGISEKRDMVTPVGGNVSVANGEIVINGTAEKTALYTRRPGRYLPGLYGLAGIGVRADFSTGTYEYGYGDEGENRIGVEWVNGDAFTFVDSFGSRYYRKARADWLDPLDGTGPSGLTLDPDNHVLRMLIGWYGHLPVRFYLSVTSREGGERLVLIDRADIRSSGVTFEQPDLPVFAEADGGTLYVGGRQYGVYGRYMPEYRITTAFGSATVDTSFTPVLSFRIKAPSNWGGVPVLISGLSLLSADSAEVAVFIGGTLTGASFGSVPNIPDSETALQVDTSATAISGGYMAFGDDVAGGSRGNTFGGEDAGIPELDVPRDQVVTLAVRALASTTTVNATLRMKEEW